VSDAAVAARRAALLLRLTLGLFLLQWGVEKFVVPESAAAIWGHFYGLSIDRTLGYAFGAVEIALAVCLFLGVLRTVAYAAAMGLHAVSVAVSWRQLIDPWADPANHLFIAGVPVLGGFVALFLLRRWDRGAFAGGREAPSAAEPAAGKSL
jgi:putative oxidoreductase